MSLPEPAKGGSGQYEYAFRVSSGSTLWVDGVLCQTDNANSCVLGLKPGEYPIRLDTVTESGPIGVNLEWLLPGASYGRFR